MENMSRPSQLGISHVWLYAKNVSKSIAFYEDTLGLQIVRRFPHGALFRGGRILLGVHEEEGERSHEGGMLVVFQTENVTRTFEDLKQRGIGFLKDHVETEDFGQVADFHDPDGYFLEIWQPPRRQH